MSARPAAPRAGRRRALAALPAAAALSACGALDLGGGPRFEFYVIEDLRAGEPAPAPGPRLERALLLTTGPTPALFDSDRIVYTRDGVGRAYYQYSNWAERPLRRIVALAEQRLDRAGRFRSVAQTLSGVRGDVLLALRLDELLHDDGADPGEVRLGLGAELVDWRTRLLLGRRTIVRRARVRSRDAAGAAQAASVAVSEALDELAPWIEASLGAMPASAARD
ncbi:MAG TPA: ABC-type transport auxiliary lipoprotein family protein [Burkholderiaceae bacterium]|nr:ABC-type transport auxiliary lipoprotein family protein [Burkholderiaceae bacterium]